MIKITIFQHTGELDIDTDCVIFYDTCFDTIIEASKLLNNLSLPTKADVYTSWYCRGQKFIMNEKNNKIFWNNIWVKESEVIKHL